MALAIDRVQTLALALHELATNALKYGALKEEAGRLAISWLVRRDAQDAPILVLDWVERGVPDVRKPSRTGFGTNLLEKALQFTLRATVELTFGTDGVSCHIEMPLSEPAGAEDGR